MKLPLTIIAAAFVATAWAIAIGRAQANTLTPAQRAAIDTAVRHSMATQHLPSVVIEVDRNGQRVFAQAWGERNVEDAKPAQQHRQSR